MVRWCGMQRCSSCPRPTGQDILRIVQGYIPHDSYVVRGGFLMRIMRFSFLVSKVSISLYARPVCMKKVQPCHRVQSDKLVLTVQVEPQHYSTKHWASIHRKGSVDLSSYRFISRAACLPEQFVIMFTFDMMIALTIVVFFRASICSWRDIVVGQQSSRIHNRSQMPRPS